LASYINHLVRTRRATDLEVFDALMQGAGDGAQEVLERFRDSHAFDPEKILATELTLLCMKTSFPSSIRMMPGKSPNTREHSTW
jgi:methanogenic corrinoid protein MtbC1